MSNLDKNSEAKSCCQQEQNADSGEMPLATEAGCCSTGSASDLNNKAILNLLPVISNQVGGSTRVAVGQISKTNGSGDAIASLRQIGELGASCSSDTVSSGCGCGPSNESDFLNIKAKSKFGVNSGDSGQIEANRSEWVSQNHELIGEFQIGSPVGKPSQVTQQDGATAKTSHIQKVLLENQSDEQTHTGANQSATEQPAMAGSKSFVDHSNSLSDGALSE